jgi:hypothetical protein
MRTWRGLAVAGVVLLGLVAPQSGRAVKSAAASGGGVFRVGSPDDWPAGTS